MTNPYENITHGKEILSPVGDIVSLFVRIPRTTCKEDPNQYYYTILEYDGSIPINQHFKDMLTTVNPALIMTDEDRVSKKGNFQVRYKNKYKLTTPPDENGERQSRVLQKTDTGDIVALTGGELPLFDSRSDSGQASVRFTTFEGKGKGKGGVSLKQVNLMNMNLVTDQSWSSSIEESAAKDFEAAEQRAAKL